MTSVADIAELEPSARATTVASALEFYAEVLASPQRRRVNVHARDGARLPLILDRWLGAVDDVDRDALARCRGPVLDIGCGPGRHVNELAGQGLLALGVDVSATAVALARDRGAAAVVASVFDRLPGAWRTALLLDGNIGIGGRPLALLRRVNDLLAADGEVIVELAPPEVESSVMEVRFELPGRVSDWFPWAVLAADQIDATVRAAGLVVVERWERGGRYFARAARRRARIGA